MGDYMINILEHAEKHIKERNTRSTNYTINEVGSSVCKYPSRLAAGDILTFNITNNNIETKYTGTMLTYTFPVDCSVLIYAAGARGGMGNKATLSTVGLGAVAVSAFDFKEGDTLLMCVGQAGTDYSGSNSDGTTGAGGGGSFVTLKTTDGTGNTYNGSGVGNGWKVKPLLIGAGGNGSRDVGYSGTSKLYHGQAFGGSAPTYGTYSGGGYASSHTTTNAGKSFLNGASGATANYTRNSTSIAGFGCGGGNRDDGDGGGGGGYHGGLNSRSAYSYVDTSLSTDNSCSAGENDGEGYIDICILSVDYPAKVKINVNDTWKDSTEIKVNVNGTWENATQVFMNVNGIWKESI